MQPTGLIAEVALYLIIIFKYRCIQKFIVLKQTGTVPSSMDKRISNVFVHHDNAKKIV